MGNNTFSKELVERCVVVFKEDHGVTLSADEAVEALDNLGGLFLSFLEQDGLKMKNED